MKNLATVLLLGLALVGCQKEIIKPNAPSNVPYPYDTITVEVEEVEPVEFNWYTITYEFGAWYQQHGNIIIVTDGERDVNGVGHPDNGHRIRFKLRVGESFDVEFSIDYALTNSDTGPAPGVSMVSSFPSDLSGQIETVELVSSNPETYFTKFSFTRID